MKRPLATIGFSYLISLIIAALLDFNGALALCIALLLSTIILILFKYQKPILICILLTTSIALGTYCAYTQVYYKPVASLAGTTAEITGTVIGITKNTSYYSYKIRCDQIAVDGAPKNVVTEFQTPHKLELDFYDKLTYTTQFKSPPEKGLLSTYQSKGIFILAPPLEPFEDNEQVEYVAKKPFYYHILKLRQHFLKSIDIHTTPAVSNVLKGMVLGEKYTIDAVTSQNFSRSGIRHILTVSGYHISIIAQTIFLLLSILRLSRRKKALITILFIVLFMAIAGFGVSVIRAGLMSCIYFIGIALKKQPDPLNSLGLAALVLCLFNPYSATDLGLLLSFAATFAIILGGRRICVFVCETLAIKTKVGRFLAENFCTSLCASIGILPLCVIAFQEVSLVAPLSNMIASPIITVSLCSGLLVGVIGSFPSLSVLLPPIVAIANFSTNWLIQLAEFFTSIPFTYLCIGFEFLYLAMIATILLVSIGFFLKNRRKGITLSLVMASFVLVCGIGSYQLFMNSVIEISTIRSGFDYAVVITAKDKAVVINRSGSEQLAYETANYLNSKFVDKIELYITTSLTSNQLPAIAHIANNFKLAAIIAPNNEFFSPLSHQISSNTVLSPLEDFTTTLTSDIIVTAKVTENDTVFLCSYGSFQLAIGSHYAEIEKLTAGKHVQALILYNKINKQFEKLGKDYVIMLENDYTVVSSKKVVQKNSSTLLARKNGQSILK